MIVEDDCKANNPGRLFGVDLPQDAELVFVNRRGDPKHQQGHGVIPRVYPALDMFRDYQEETAPGGDGYLLSPTGASKLLSGVATDGFDNHVDWRLLRYSIDQTEVAEWNARRPVRAHLLRQERLEDVSGRWNIVRGYCISPSVISAGMHPSSRKMIDLRHATAPPVLSSIAIVASPTAIGDALDEKTAM